MVARSLSQLTNQAASQDAGRGPLQGSTPAFSRLALPANPTVAPSADIHDFCLIEGDVRIGPGVMVAPGAAVTAASGASVQVGDRCCLLPGVVVEGVAGARVTATSGSYSVCVGDRSIVAHKSLIHGPAFIGADCFIGFRSTVFNARLGDGCVVMMHALVQDVEVPPGRCIPSGSVITAQHQADQLPKVRPEDLEFAKEVVGASTYAFIHSGPSSRDRPMAGNYSGNHSRGGSGYGAASRQSGARLKPVHSPVRSSAQPSAQSASSSDSFRRPSPLPYATEGANMQAQRLSPEIVQQVRQFLAQGYRIGMEHADKRRYRSGVWETCTPIKDTREQAVFAALEQCLAEHSGEYVRMFGIDQKVKRRVGMVTVQRPDGKPVSIDGKSAQATDSRNGSGYYSASNSGYSNGGSGSAAGGLTPAIMQEVSNLLRGGYIIGTEHADPRRYRSNVWKSCSPIDTTREQEVFSRLRHCLEEHSGEYVRMFGIDPQAKRRVSSTTIQRADGKPVEISSRSVAPASGGARSGSQAYASGPQAASAGGNWSGGSGNNSAAAEAAGQILRQGAQIGIEFADARRYRSGIWQTAPKANSVGELQKFLSTNADKYVRIFSVNTAQKTRGAATTIHKPGQAQPSASVASTNDAQAARGPIYNHPPRYDDPPNQSVGAVESGVMDQVTQLVNQGFRISIEFADKRRFRSGIWQTGEAITARRPAEAISALGQQLARHQGNYVRLVGVDPQAKRRVLEITIQRP